MRRLHTSNDDAVANRRMPLRTARRLSRRSESYRVEQVEVVAED